MTLDRYLIHLHQQVVDTLQRRPVQIARGVTAVYIVACAIDLVNRPDPVLLTLYPILAVLFLFFSKNDYGYARLSDAKLTRLLLFACMAGEVLGNVFAAEVNFAALISTTCVVAYYYFAACTPPKPPKRKEKLFLNLKGQT